MPLETDAIRNAVYFDPAAFGVLATIKGVPNIPGILRRGYLGAELDGVVMHSNEALFTTNSVPIATVTNGDTASIPVDTPVAKTQNYVIVEAQRDGTGMTVLRLQEV